MSDVASPRSIGTDDVLRWHRERTSALDAVAELQSKIAELDRKIDAAKILFPEISEELGVASKGLDMGADSISTWGELVIYTLSRAEGGITQAQILEAGKKSAIADRVKLSPSSLYNATKKMVDKGTVIRNGGLFYLPSLWDSIQRGEVKDKIDRTPGDSQQAVIRCLAAGGIMLPREIAAVLKDDPVTAKQVRGNSSYIHTLLSRMFDRGVLMKDPEGRYSTPTTNETSTGIPVDVSAVGEAPTSPVESQSVLRLIG